MLDTKQKLTFPLIDAKSENDKSNNVKPYTSNKKRKQCTPVSIFEEDNDPRL